MDAIANDRPAPVALLALCFLVPVALTWGFYAAEQQTVQRPARVNLLEPVIPAAGLQYLIDDNRALDRKYHRVAGWVLDPANDIDWLRPSLLVVAPDGKAVEFRTNIQRRTDLPRALASERQNGIAGFEVRMKTRYLPAGEPLKLYLVVHRQGRKEVIDTGSALASGGPR